MKRIFAVAAVAALSVAALTAAPAAAVNIVTNGSFETGDFSGWTQEGDTSFSFVTDEAAAGGPTDGVFHAAFGPVGALGGILQILSTVAGGSYFVSFDLAYIGGTPNGFVFLWDGAPVVFVEDSNSFDYGTASGILTASSASTPIDFVFFSPPSYWLLDNVSVELVSAAVPEPATWALFIAGFGLVGSVVRRRRVVGVA